MKAGIYSEKLKALAASIDECGDFTPYQYRRERDNPFCGDRVTLGMDFDNGRVGQLAHKVRGCLICKAATATLGQSAIGLSRTELEDILAKLRQMLATGEAITEGSDQLCDELKVFSPVSEHRSRHSCLLLPFETLAELLADAEIESDIESEEDTFE